MTSKRLRGVIAAIATACDERNEIDLSRSLKFARYLLDNGCDGLNVLGTTGEATSFSLAQRQRLMSAYKSDGLPLDRLMVGTGAAAVSDAISLTQHAADLGFAGALVLPAVLLQRRAGRGPRGLYRRHRGGDLGSADPDLSLPFPGHVGVPWRLELIQKLRQTHGDRIAGLKDSSGDMPYARAATDIGDDFDVFPSTEAVLLEARRAPSRAASRRPRNSAPDLCARAWRQGDKQRARRRGRDPQAVRRQAAGFRHQIAAGAHPWRSRLGAHDAAARRSIRRRTAPWRPPAMTRFDPRKWPDRRGFRRFSPKARDIASIAPMAFDAITPSRL